MYMPFSLDVIQCILRGDGMKYLDFTVAIEDVLLDARVDYADEPHYIREQSMQLHEHLLYEVYFIENGRLTLQCDKTKLFLEAGDILIISPHVPHKILSYEKDLVRFNLQFMGRISEKRPYTFLCPSAAAKKEIFTLISLIRGYLSSTDNNADVFRMNHAFSILLSHVVEPVLSPETFRPGTNKRSRLQQLVAIDQFFFDRYAEPCTIMDLAAVLNYSKAQTRRILLEYTGVSFPEKLRQHRISAAKQYLRNSSFSVDEIAERCGYQSRMGFENAFKKSVGMSPHKFRASEDKL